MTMLTFSQFTEAVMRKSKMVYGKPFQKQNVRVSPLLQRASKAIGIVQPKRTPVVRKSLRGYMAQPIKPIVNKLAKKPLTKVHASLKGYMPTPIKKPIRP